MSCMARSRNLVAIAGSLPLENINQTWPRWSNWSIADATASSSFDPRQTAAFIVILKFGLTVASFPRSASLSASTCIPSTSAAARRTERNSSRSACDWRGTSKAATVLILSGCDATPQPTITAQIAANTSRHTLAPLTAGFRMPWKSILPPAGGGLGAINISPSASGSFRPFLPLASVRSASFRFATLTHHCRVARRSFAVCSTCFRSWPAAAISL